MTYLDTSVALAHLLAEDRAPSPDFWRQTFVSSRLLEYEMWNRIHSRGLERSHGEALRQLVGRIALLELSPPVLARAREPFPTPVRTLDALHLASMHFLREQGQDVTLASYDARMRQAAKRLRFALVTP
jgi:uncharacterized protein